MLHADEEARSDIHREAIDSQESFESHQLLFDYIIEKLPASARLLTRIKLEYELVLKKILKSRSNLAARVLQQNLQATEIETLRNYLKRMKELEVKLARIKADNIRIQNEIDQMSHERNAIIAKNEKRVQSVKFKLSLQSNVLRRTSLGLPLDGATSVSYLQKHLRRVEAKLAENKEVTEKKYVPAQKKSKLQDQLKGKEASRTILASENRVLGMMVRKFNVASQAVESYLPYMRHHKIDPSNFSVEGYITTVIASQPSLEDDVSDEEPEDPNKDMEAEMILDCYEKFNELFESEKYEEAALHAATSPKGIMRVLKTLLLFKSSARHHPGRKLPLLCYCEYLLQCAPAFRPISLEESIESAKCILDQGEMNKLIYWIAQGSMPSSIQLGNLISNNCCCSKLCSCGRKSLAFTVFDHCQAINQAAICLIQQGKLVQFLSFAVKARLAKQDYVELLCTAPSAEFALLLIDPPHPHKPPLMDIFELMLLLLKRGASEDAIKYLHAYLKKLGCSLVQAIINNDRITEDLLEDLISQLHNSGSGEMALDLVASWTVKSAIQKSILQLKQDPSANQYQSSSSTFISDTESETASGSYNSSQVPCSSETVPSDEEDTD